MFFYIQQKDESYFRTHSEVAGDGQSGPCSLQGPIDGGGCWTAIRSFVFTYEF